MDNMSTTRNPRVGQHIRTSCPKSTDGTSYSDDLSQIHQLGQLIRIGYPKSVGGRT